MSSVAKISKKEAILVMLVNRTNITFTIRKGRTLAKIEPVHGQNMSLFSEITKHTDSCKIQNTFEAMYFTPLDLKSGWC